MHGRWQPRSGYLTIWLFEVLAIGHGDFESISRGLSFDCDRHLRTLRAVAHAPADLPGVLIEENERQRTLHIHMGEAGAARRDGRATASKPYKTHKNDDESEWE